MTKCILATVPEPGHWQKLPAVQAHNNWRHWKGRVDADDVVMLVGPDANVSVNDHLDAIVAVCENYDALYLAIHNGSDGSGLELRGLTADAVCKRFSRDGSYAVWASLERLQTTPSPDAVRDLLINLELDWEEEVKLEILHRFAHALAPHQLSNEPDAREVFPENPKLAAALAQIFRRERALGVQEKLCTLSRQYDQGLAEQLREGLFPPER